jgi:hypothetical protein
MTDGGGVQQSKTPSSMSTDPSHHVRRVVLPSGKTIEVVYFDDFPAEPTAPAQPALPADANDHTDDLHVCGTCSSQLVYPVEWHEAGARHWEVTLRCPNCEWIGTGIFDQALVERFDTELDRATSAMVGDLQRLVHTNMQDEIERFVSALEADAITPEDF